MNAWGVSPWYIGSGLFTIKLLNPKNVILTTIWNKSKRTSMVRYICTVHSNCPTSV